MPQLNLTYIGTEIDTFKVYHVSIFFKPEKVYTYAINSEFAHRLFLKKIKKKQFKKALNILNKFKIEAFWGKEE